MPETVEIGLFCDLNAIYCVERSDETQRSFSIDIEEMGGPKDKYVRTNIDLISVLQTMFRSQRFATKKVNLSLPSQDIIFRSFKVPPMQRRELKSAVEFEAKKYIPFNIEDLTYTFSAKTIIEERIKRVKVTFIAVKKTTLNHYLTIFKNAGIEVDVVEPEPFSLVRNLVRANSVPQEGTVAIVRKGESGGKIIISEGYVPLFVREFSLTMSDMERAVLSGDEMGEDDHYQKFINEIRVSLDFFNRQGSEQAVKEIFLLLEITDETHLKALVESKLSIPVKIVDYRNSLTSNIEKENTVGHFTALGAAQTSLVPEVNADLLAPQKTLQKVRLKRKPIKVNYKQLVPVFIICALVLSAELLYLRNTLRPLRSEQADLETELSDDRDIAVSDIEQDTEEIRQRLEKLRQIRTESHSAVILYETTRLLPSNGWLIGYSLNFVDVPVKKETDESSEEKKTTTGLKINLSGYVYSPVYSEQFNLVNRYQKSLQENEVLSSFFKKFDLVSVRSERIDMHAVTFFEIQAQ